MLKEKITKEAFLKGCPNFKGPIFFGTSNNNLEKCYEYRKKGIDFVYIDMPYFDSTRYHFVGNNLEKSYFRVCFNCVFVNKIYSVPEDRFEDLKIETKEWKKNGNNIVFFMSSPIVTNFFSNHKKIEKTIEQIKKIYPNKKIKISYKKSSKLVTKLVPIKDQVEDCLFTVSITSLAAIQSIILGVPSFCHEESPCAPVSGKLDGDFRKIKYPENRIEWLKTLAYGQYNLEEISRGLPYLYYREYFC